MPATVLQFRNAEWQEAETCCACGVEFASPVIRKRRDDGKLFWCPNGHSQSYRKTNEQKLREELDAEKRRREQAERDAEWARSAEKGARIQEGKAKAKLKRLETRVNAGVCPHCQRTFKQLAQHMKCKHAGINSVNSRPGAGEES